MAVNRRGFLQASLGALLTPRAGRAAESSLVWRPYVQNVRRTRAVIRWTTTEAGSGQLFLLAPDGRARQIDATTNAIAPSHSGLPWRYQHEAAIGDLTPATDYGYRVLVNGRDVGGDSLGFRTAGSNAFQFLAIGDTGTGSAEQRLLAALMKNERPRLVIHTGDVGYPSGNYETYERHYFDYYQAVMQRVPFYPCPGNHDYYEPGAEPYFAVHHFPSDDVPEQERGRYYSVEWADAEFFSLDSNATLEAAASGRSGMLTWLDRKLKQSRKFWRVVFFHHPPNPTGHHVGDPLCELARRHIAPILERNRVPLVLNGHEHNYQRSHPGDAGPVYVTTGGGGAELHEFVRTAGRAAGATAYHYVRGEVDGRTLTLSAIGIDGRGFDSVGISAQPRLAPAAAVNSASLQQEIGRGALLSVLGWQMSVDTLENGGRPLGAQAGGVAVSVNGVPLPLLLVSPSQLNAILPPELEGLARLEVTTPAGSARAEFEIARIAPALFPGAFVDGSGLAADAVRAGEVAGVLATGMSAHHGSVKVHIGRLITEGRLVEGDIAGLQQVYFEIPSLAAGIYPLTIEAAGIRSNAVDLRV